MSFFTVPPNQLSVDSCIVGTPDFYIVETDADATAANAAGFPSIAFPNNFRNDENYKIIIDISLKSKRIFIINSTNDTARLGEIGMRLAAQGLAVFILSIPVDTPSGTKGLEDYFKTNQPADFKALVKKAPGFIDLLIANLPENFPHALPDLRDKILPLLLRVDTTTQKHYANLMSKKVKTTTKIITDMLDKLISRTKADEKSADQSEEIDPEIQAAAMALLQDPQVFKKRIDAINLSGVVGERTNISLYFVTLDSRLSKDFGKPGQRALALKSAGHFGAGKSFSLSSCLTIYPPKAYHLLTSGSEKSLYYLPDGLSHKCLIVAEGYQFTGERGDNEISFIVRCLISEGQVVRIVVEKGEDGQQVTRRIEIPGPTSFITTTVVESLEAQLEDRLLSIHPSESADQTRKIIESLAEQSENNSSRLSEREIKIWQTLHTMLEPVSVSIPFASKIAQHISNMPYLPISMRRGFGKVLNVIRAIACLYQYQRQKDENGNIVAEIADYSMTWQIVQDAFKENMGQTSKSTDQRLQYIRSVGHVSLKDLSIKEGHSRAALSSWMKRAERDGDAQWVDNKGNEFQNDNLMKAAKRSGKAHIAVTSQYSKSMAFGLPSPSEIMNSASDWAPGGSEFEKYNLNLNPDLSAMLSHTPLPLPLGPKPATTLANPTPVPIPAASGLPVTQQPVRVNSFAFSPDGTIGTTPVGFIEGDPLPAGVDDQLKPYDPVADEELILDPDDPNYKNPLI